MTPPEALQFAPFVNPLLLAAAAALLVLSVRRAYVRTTRRVPGIRRFLLVLLRIFAVASVLLCLARPVLVQQRQLHEQGLCFVALDSSASMDLRDTAGGRTRWETASAIIAGQKKELARLGAECDLQRYVFDSSMRKMAALPGENPVDIATAGLGPHGLATDLTLALDTIAAEAGGSPGASALLISDGRHNVPKDILPAALTLQRSGVPVYCIGLGQEATPVAYKDIRIRELLVPEKAFVGSRMVLRVDVEATLPEPQVVPLTVEIAGKRVYEGKISLPQGVNMPVPSVEIPYVPQALGVHRVVATLGTVPDEADTANNTRHAFFRVYRSKLGIWYVEGAIRKEYGAVCGALATAPNIRFKALNAFDVTTSPRGELLPAGAEDREQLKLVIIGDLPADRFDEAALTDLAKFVEDGGAVLMIGGAANLGEGKWQRSPLAPVLPVELTAKDGVHNGPLPIVVSAGEATHPVLALADTQEQSAALWKLLPPVPMVDCVGGVRPAAHVLLRAGSSELVVVQEFGKGRSAVITADTTWQWALKAGQGELQKRFWRNLVTWLTRSDYRDSDKAVFADAERLQYRLGDEAALRVLVHETERVGPALKTARVAITLSRFQNDIEAPVLREDVGVGPGEYTRQFALGQPGTYRFRAEAIAGDGRVLDGDGVDIQVVSPDVEHDNPKANLGLLRRIATLSGGMYFDPEHASEAFQALRRRQASYSKTVTDVTELWSQPWMLAVFFSVLTLEWMLRKRWGLV